MPKSWLALGDSYTIGESVREIERYPEQTVGILKKSGILFNGPEIIARTGWTTADLLQAIEEKQTSFRNYDVVTLLIGVNNQYQGGSPAEYKEQFSILLERSIKWAAQKAYHVIVLSIPDYSVTPFAHNLNTARISGEIVALNRINKEAAMDFKVNYLDITVESGKAANDPSLIAEDGLHFSGKEYAIWSQLLAELIQDKLE